MCQEGIQLAHQFLEDSSCLSGMDEVRSSLSLQRNSNQQGTIHTLEFMIEHVRLNRIDLEGICIVNPQYNSFLLDIRSVHQALLLSDKGNRLGKFCMM